MLLGHLLPQVFEHREQLLVGGSALAHRGYGLGLLLLLVVIVIESHGHRERQGDISLALFIDRNKAVILDILVHQPQNQRLSQHRTPEPGVVLGAGPEPFRLVMAVAFDQRRGLAHQHIDQVVGLELVADVAQGFEGHLQGRLGIDLRLRIAAVVAVAAVVLGIVLAEIVQQRLAAAHRTLGIGDRLQQQQLADLLFGDGLALHELLEFLNILIAVKGQAVTLAAVTAGAAGLLVVPLQRFGNVVVNDVAHVGLVDAHAESDRGDDHLDALHQEIVLVGSPRHGVHARMVGQRTDAVGDEQLGKLLDLLAAQAVNDAALALVLFDEADDVAVDVALGADLIVEVRPVERRFEDRGVGHAQVLLNIQLHLGRGRGREGDQRRGADLVDDRADAAVLGPEVVSPLRDAVRLVDGVERHLYLMQERHVVLLGERLGGEIEQFGLPGEHVGADLRHGGLVERRIEEMRDSRLSRECAHRVDLVLHQGDQRRDNDGDPVHQERRQLIAQRLAAARRHQHEGIIAFQHVADHRFLVPFERRKAEVLLQFVVQQG